MLTFLPCEFYSNLASIKMDLVCFIYIKASTGENFPFFLFFTPTFFSVWVMNLSGEKTQSLQSEKYPGPIEVCSKCREFTTKDAVDSCCNFIPISLDGTHGK